MLRARTRPTLGLSDLPIAFTRDHPQRGYDLLPSASIDYAGITTSLNRLGLRGPEPDAAARGAILLLGDELTFGWGVADEDTYPAQLERWVRERCPGCGPVLNAGVPGYTSYQGLLLLRELGVRFRPRAVVVQFHLNDALMDGEEHGADDRSPSTRGWDAADRWLRHQSAAYGWARGVASAPPRGWWRAAPRTPLGRYRRNLRALAAEARRLDAGLVLLNIGFGPDSPRKAGRAPRRLRRGHYEGDYQAATRLAALLDGASLVDFLGGELELGTMLDAFHPNAEGYRRIATRVGQAIAAQGVLDR
jgi:lysophospholipase L1-like esterase